MTQDRSVKDTVLFVLSIFAASLVILCFLYPEFWFFHTRRVCICFDLFIPFESTYMLVSHSFHGGIQLWDRFDQMNYAYYVLSFGMYGVANVLTALIYILLSLFFTHPAQALYHTYFLFFFSVTCFIRTIGGYLLLRKFVANKAVILISIIYLNTILTSYNTTPGFLLEGIYSFLPLTLYFILCFFEDLNVRAFLLLMLAMSICFACSPLYTLGYYYQGLHFVVLSCVVSFLLRRDWRKLRGRSPLPRMEFLQNIGLATCCFLIILPYCWWGRSLMHDFFLYGSGLGGTQGRFDLIFNFKGYFYVQGRGFANPLEFLGTSLNYHHNIWGGSWLFVGGSTLFFVLAALVLSKDRRKYIFAATVLFIVLINTACYPNNFFVLPQYLQYAFQHPGAFWARGIHWDEWGIYLWLFLSSIAHGINVLTNPFSFLVRGFNIEALLMPILLLPLVAMGLDACLQCWQRKADLIHFNRRWILLIFCIFLLLWDLSGGTKTLGVYEGNQATAQNLKFYILSLGTIFLMYFLTCKFFHPDKRWMGWIILGLAFAVDLVALKTYSKFDFIDNLNIAPTRLSPTYTHQAVMPDYQNPRVFPFREFFNTNSRVISPDIDESLEMYGTSYQYTPMGRFFHPWYIYSPTHIAYKDIYPDLEIQQYLIRNPRNIFFADYAFDSRFLKMSDILRSNLEERVVLADPQEQNEAFIKKNERVYIPPMNLSPKIYSTSLDWSMAQIHQSKFGWEYTFDLPNNFPFYLSTTIFTYDYASWRLSIGSRILDPMQGALTAPYTYDVQNIQDKKITILLPDARAPWPRGKLSVKLPDRILDVWKNTYDDLGLTYDAPRDGWLIFNYPYDDKWELSIDGQTTPLSRVNRYFIGSPISAGKHHVLLRFWPSLGSFFQKTEGNMFLSPLFFLWS